MVRRKMGDGVALAGCALCCDVIRLSGTLTSRHRARYKADGDIMWRLYRGGTERVPKVVLLQPPKPPLAFSLTQHSIQHPLFFESLFR